MRTNKTSYTHTRTHFIYPCHAETFVRHVYFFFLSLLYLNQNTLRLHGMLAFTGNLNVCGKFDSKIIIILLHWKHAWVWYWNFQTTLCYIIYKVVCCTYESILIISQFPCSSSQFPFTRKMFVRVRDIEVVRDVDENPEEKSNLRQNIDNKEKRSENKNKNVI